MKRAILLIAVVAAFPGLFTVETPSDAFVLAGVETGFITNQASNTVSVFNTFTGASLYPDIAVGPAPRHIIGVQFPFDQLYVGNTGDGTMSIISLSTFTVVNTVSFTNMTNMGGMTLSADQRAIFVAGYNVSAGQAGVWQLDLNTETQGYVGGITTALVPADVEVVREDVFGGPVNASPGMLFFSVPDPGPNPGFLGQIDLNPLSLPTSQPPPSTTTDPTMMARTPDDLRVVVTCSTAGGTLPVIDILSANGIASAQQINVGPPVGGANTIDISMRPELAPQRAYILCGGALADTVVQYDPVNMLEINRASSNPPPNVDTITYITTPGASNNRLFLGNSNLGSPTFQVLNAPAGSPPLDLADWNSGGNGPKYVVIESVMPPTGPPPPTGLVAIPGNGLVDLTWNPAAGAATYNVKRSTTMGGPYTTIGTGVVPTTFTDNTVTNGTTYYYVVSGVDGGGGEGPDSTEASARPFADGGVFGTNPSQFVDVFDRATGAFRFDVDLGVGGDLQDGILAVPALQRVYVAHNSNPGTVSVIDTSVFPPVFARRITVPNSFDLRDLVVSADHTRLYIAGRHTGLNQAGVFELDLTVVPETPGYVAGVNSTNHGEGLAVVREEVYTAGGGNAPGVIYFTDTGTPSQIVAIDLQPALSITAVGPPAGIFDLKDLSLAPDQQSLLVCGTATNPDEVSVVFVDTTTLPPVPALAVIDAAQFGLNNITLDVRHRPDLPVAAYVIAELVASGTTALYTVDDVGAAIAGPTATGAPPQVEMLMHFVEPGSGVDRIFMGDDLFASSNAQVMDSSGFPAAPTPLGADPFSPNGTPFQFAYAPLAPLGGGPPAPTGLTALGGDMFVDLTWNAAAGATTYNVKRSTTPGGPYTTIATGIVPTAYTDNTVTNGTTYYYVVSGVNGGGTEGANSTEANALPLGGPPAPGNLVATPGNMQVDLTWNASPGAVDYNIKRALVTGGPYVTIQTGVVGTNFTDNTVTNGTTYFYVVSGVNAVPLEGPDSLEASATPMAPPPPRLDRICPKGAPNVAGLPLVVEGADFQPGAEVRIDGILLPTTFVSSSRLNLTTTGTLPQLLMLDVEVRNPDAQTDLLQTHFANFTPPGTSSTFPLTLPSVSDRYQLLSLPQFASVADLRAALEATLGAYNPNVYRVFFRIRNQYVELPNVAADECLMGVSFWVLTRFGAQISVTAPEAERNPPSLQDRVIPLFPGWNMISVPFDFTGQSLLWSDVNVTADGTDLTTATAANGSPLLMNPVLYARVSNQYMAATQMQAGEGYFVSNRTSGMLYLVMNPTDAFKATVPLSYAPLPPGSSSPPAPPSGPVGESESKSACGLGVEGLLLVLAWRVFPRLRRRRRLAS